MTIQNVLDWLQEAEDNNCWQVSTQSIKRHLEEVQKQQLILYGVSKSFYCYNKEKGFNHSLCEVSQCEKCKKVDEQMQ